MTGGSGSARTFMTPDDAPSQEVPMRCCVLQHLAFEDLGTFAPVLLETGWTIQACHVADGLPDARDWRDADLCIVLGGPMGVHDGAAYPFLSRELELVRSRLGEGRPLLGICLGAQLMAQALGAAVYAGKAKEIGWGGLQLTEAGAASPLAALRGAPRAALARRYLRPAARRHPAGLHGHHAPSGFFRQGQASWPCNSMPRPTPPAWSTGSWGPCLRTGRRRLDVAAIRQDARDLGSSAAPPDKISSAAG